MEQSTKFFNQIPIQIIEAPDLSDFEKLLFSEIYTMANSYGSIFPSNPYLAKRYGKTKGTISANLKKLEAKGYIKLEYDIEQGEVKRRYISLCIEKSLGGIPKNPHTPTEKSLGGIPKNRKYNKSTNISTNKSINNNTLGKPNTAVPYSEIIQYLNEKTGKKFNSDAFANKKLIKARWNEGYRLDEFKKVIDNMCKEWQGVVFGNGKSAEAYLKPDTLFAGKFDKYLNTESSTSKPTSNKLVKPAPEWSNTNVKESMELSEERKKELWDKHGIEWD